MVDTMELRTRAATLADADAIAAIYNDGIADRIATFETEPRSTAQIAEWFAGRQLVIIAETQETGPVAFAASFPYSDRACYSGIGEFSVYVRRNYRGRGADRAVFAALIEAAFAAGLHKLTSRVFGAIDYATGRGWGYRKHGASTGFGTCCLAAASDRGRYPGVARARGHHQP